MIELIKNAIRERKKLTIYYAPGEREIEPHALGTSKDGNILLRAFQTAGASASNEHKDWKLFRIDRMGGASGNGGEFNGPRPDYKKGDKAMKGGIIAEL
ncbi:MAG: WYL domain-containing protein [Alphaproteobacteria bacterium]|nr:WYL domain-containing protein [Alphaproteobacteria bacterium]MBU2085475.1 WYL domain-containing protein [Alphaproteobacteria bacterium]MBU2143457.1 WYL domain-containing protein [Alphaproteobacteria bacterium]